MKLMKHITIALVLCAIPAMAFAQTAACDDCDHQVSVYHGTGGLIATADGADMVNYRATCDNVTRTGELMPNDDGVVSMLFTGDLACMEDDGTFELGPVMDGGWFWINAGDNSAVGNLVAKDVLDNMAVELTDAGDSITEVPGAGANLLMHTSGRVGLLPTILPEPPAPDAVTCGPRITPNSRPPAYTTQVAKSCMLGGGGTKVRVTGPAAHGRTGMISGPVTRPAVNTMTLMVDLWVDESGSYYRGDLTSDAALVNRGWAGKGASNWLGNTGWTASLHGATPGATLAGAGVEIADSDSNGQAEITISPSATYCPTRGSQTTAVVNVSAWGSGATVGSGSATTGTGTAEEIFPSLAPQATLGGAYAAAQIHIACPPPAAANRGQELVPDNPFPTDK